MAKKLWDITASILISANSNTNDRIVINNYWNELNNKYVSFFKDAYKYSPIYILGKRRPLILKLNNIIKRITSRFCQINL